MAGLVADADADADADAVAVDDGAGTGAGAGEDTALTSSCEWLDSIRFDISVNTPAITADNMELKRASDICILLCHDGNNMLIQRNSMVFYCFISSKNKSKGHPYS